MCKQQVQATTLERAPTEEDSYKDSALLMGTSLPISPSPPLGPPPSSNRPGPSSRQLCKQPPLENCTTECNNRCLHADGLHIVPPAGSPPVPSSKPRQHGSSYKRHFSRAFLLRDYDVLHCLGESNFGSTHVVRERATGHKRVCKVVNLLGMKENEIERVREEVRVLRSLDHPNIVKIHEYADDMELRQLIIIFEHVAGGSCASLLQRHSLTPLPKPMVARLLSQALQAVAHSHGRGVLHRDLKPEHLLLTAASSDGVQDCKIIDFGLATCCGLSPGSLCGIESEKPVGTPAYMAPEVVSKQKDISDASKSDIWSLGVTALELLTGRNPFQMGSHTSAIRMLRNFRDIDDYMASHGKTLEWCSLCPSAQNFVRTLLAVDPSKRPSAVQALQHPWLSQHRIFSGLPVMIDRSKMPHSARPLIHRLSPETIDKKITQPESGREGCLSSRSTSIGQESKSSRSSSFSHRSSTKESMSGESVSAAQAYFSLLNQVATAAQAYSESTCHSRSRHSRIGRSSSESPPGQEEHARKICLSNIGIQAMARLGG